jgi:hypothetical protein
LEVVLVTAISSLIIVVLMQCYAAGLAGSLRVRNRIDLQQNARIVLDEITGELRYATDIYDKNKFGRKEPLLMPLDGEDETGGANRLFLKGTDGQEREIKFNEIKRNVTLRQGSGPDNELGYHIKRLEFFWHLPAEMLEEDPLPEPKMILILMEAQEAADAESQSGSSYTLRNIVHLKNIKR